MVSDTISGIEFALLHQFRLQLAAWIGCGFCAQIVEREFDKVPPKIDPRTSAKFGGTPTGSV